MLAFSRTQSGLEGFKGFTCTRPYRPYRLLRRERMPAGPSAAPSEEASGAKRFALRPPVAPTQLGAQ